MNIRIINIKLLNSSGDEGFKSILFNYYKKFNIIINIFDLFKDDDIREIFINEIKKKSNSYKKIIYLLGNKLDIKCKYKKKYLF